jgi:hypothetical protein
MKARRWTDEAWLAVISLANRSALHYDGAISQVFRSHSPTEVLMKPYALVVLAGLVVVAPARGSDPINPEQFAKLQCLIKPDTGEEKWQQIPWMISLWEARKKAAGEGKPILLWEMDGHPLGCT